MAMCRRLDALQAVATIPTPPALNLDSSDFVINGQTPRSLWRVTYQSTVRNALLSDWSGATS